MRGLLIVDLQNDFAKPGGALYFEGAEKVIPYITNLVDEYIEKGLPIFYTQDWHEEDDYEFKIWNKHCVKNTKGAEIVEEIKEKLENYDKSFNIKKQRYSAFYGTNFDEILKSQNIDELHVVGLVTHICVFFTVEELRNRGIKTIVHQKGVNSYDKDLHNFAIRMMKEILLAEVI